MACAKIQPLENCALEPDCKKKELSGGCEFLGHYKNLQVKSDDPPLVRQIKEEMCAPFMKSWQSFVREPKPGKKRMTGGVFEAVIRKVFSEKLAPYQVTVSSSGKKFGFGIVDCRIEKDKCPTSIVSAKTWLGQEAVRETFATAYFAKSLHGSLNVKVFMAVFLPFKKEKDLKNLIEACAPYIDGIYSVGAPPHIDMLLDKLQTIYGS